MKEPELTLHDSHALKIELPFLKKAPEPTIHDSHGLKIELPLEKPR
jgi:hypothetical protein